MLVNPVEAIHGPGWGNRLSLKPAARTRTIGPKQVLGILIVASISAFPSPDSGTAAVVDTTLPPLPPQTRLALTLVTGPGFPSFGRIRLRTSTRSLPSSSKMAEPRPTVQGAPPLCTPAIT